MVIVAALAIGLAIGGAVGFFTAVLLMAINKDG